jgi:hypothetical protein
MSFDLPEKSDFRKNRGYTTSGLTVWAMIWGR